MAGLTGMASTRAEVDVFHFVPAGWESASSPGQTTGQERAGSGSFADDAADGSAGG